jgi:hypothetical protein
MSGNPELPFDDLLHEFDPDQNPPSVIEGLEAEYWLDAELYAPMVLLNDLITNDKFCFIRSNPLKLRWRRRR